MTCDLLPSTVPGTASSKIRGADGSNAKRRKAMVTYGRKPRPLSTTGKQFLLPSVFDLPQDESEDDRPASNEIGPSYQKPRLQDPDSDSSLLSGAEDDGIALDDGSRTISSGHGRYQQGKLKSVSTTRTKPAISHPIAKTSKWWAPSTSKVTKRRKPKPKTKTSRLPVDELQFTIGPQNDDSPSDAESESSLADPEAQDPIRGTSSPGQKVGSSPIDAGRTSPSGKRPLVSLHAFRKRFRKPPVTRKDFKQLPRKQLPGAAMPSSSRSLGDGFEGGEAIVQRKRKRRRGHVKPVTHALAALELGTGPLPPVEFTDALETCHDQPLGTGGEHELDCGPGDDKSGVAPGMNYQKLVYFLDCEDRVTLQEKSKQDLVAAQLSSISAPERRTYDADSEEEDLDMQDKEEESDQDGDQSDRLPAEEDDNMIETGSSPSLSGQSVASRDYLQSRVPTSAQRTLTHLPSTVPDSGGVHYDFRKRDTSGQPLRCNINLNGVVQVDEPIEDAANFEDLNDGHEASTRRLSFYNDINGDDMLDDDSPAPPALVTSSTRPRSILKSSSRAMHSDTTRPEHTAYNTRHNSFVQQAPSRYFSNAQDDLADAVARPYKVTKVRRQPSCLNLEHELELGREGEGVPRTSPDIPDYADVGQLHTLRKTGHATYTSSHQMAEPVDLRSLTRRVSSGHGTLSQSVRRRPSLRFRSPVKMR